MRLLAALLVLAAGCAPAETPDAPTSAPTDGARIVTIGGPITETVYALGLGDAVVGTDRSSLYPDAIYQKPRLDYFRQTSAEGVLSLDPTLVIAIEGTGPEGVLDQIRAAGVRVEVVPEVESVEDAAARVEAVARVVGREADAAGVVERMRAEVAAVEPAPSVRALFVYARGAGLVMVAGTDHAADTALRLAGAENVVTAFPGFRPLTAEAVAGAAPDVIVIPERGLESLGGVEGLLAQPGLAQTPAGQTRRVVTVDDALLLGMGPRLGEGLRALADGLRAATAEATEIEA